MIKAKGGNKGLGLEYEQTSRRMLLEGAELESVGVSFNSFKSNLSILNFIFMKDRRFYEIVVSNISNSVVFYFLMYLLVNTSYLLVFSQPLLTHLRLSWLSLFLRSS